MSDRHLTRLRGGWAATWYEDGKRRRYSLGTSDKKEAERLLIQFSALKDSEAQASVRALWELYRKDRKGRRIAESMDFTGRILLPVLGDHKPEEITAEVCRSYMAKRKAAGKKPGTYWTELNHLQIMLNWAHKTRRIPHEIHVERPAKPPARDVRLTREEAGRLLANAKAPHIELAIALMLYTAARSGAVRELTWDRVNFETGLIDLALPDEEMHRKGRAVVPMNADLRRRLIEAKKRAESAFVVEWAGKQVGSFKTGFRRAAEDAELKGVTPHTLRHTAASWMAERGESMSRIAAMLGHSDSRTTERIYAKFSPTYLRSAADALDLSDVLFITTEPQSEKEVGKVDEQPRKNVLPLTKLR